MKTNACRRIVVNGRSAAACWAFLFAFVSESTAFVALTTTTTTRIPTRQSTKASIHNGGNKRRRPKHLLIPIYESDGDDKSNNNSNPNPISESAEAEAASSKLRCIDASKPLSKGINETECGDFQLSGGGGASIKLNEVDVLYERSTDLVYDPKQDRYRYRKDERSFWLADLASLGTFFRRVIAPQLSVAFLPSGVTPNYYRFMRWRVMQRFVNANLNVFGTQSLLMGLGIKSSASQLGALSAALKWVLKDALGKMVRMAWASRMGGRFDSDAKRWRFRSAFVFALGNALEITTFIIPRMFLVWATLANCCKQISMLTSSSTRTAIYNSFRDGSRENIGDITAKGEAQIAIVDLFGIASGVSLSRAVGTSVQSVLCVYAVLQTLEIACMYRQLRTVVYRVLNFERMSEVMEDFLDTMPVAAVVPANDTSSSSTALDSTTRMMTIGNVALEAATVDSTVWNGTTEQLLSTTTTTAISGVSNTGLNGIPKPPELARTERIFLPPKHLSRKSTAYGSIGRTKLSPAELERLLKIFAKERFLLVVGANLKRPRFRKLKSRLPKDQLLKEHCHIVLHKDANNLDIVKSSLALSLFRRKLVAAAASSSELDPWTIRSSDCFDLLEETVTETDRLIGLFRRQLSKQGWESPARFMFGRVHMRAEWPLPLKQ